jgi:ribonucleoside-diphosphate reductase alpha chain
MSDVILTPNAREVFTKRYVRKNPDGTPAETIEEVFRRVANVVASAESTVAAQHEMSDEFYALMVSLDFLPNSPTFTGAGTPLGNLAACYVLDIEDDMGASPEGIFSTLRTAALIQQTGGGNGFSFTDLRPRGDIVKSSNGAASGPISFLTAYNAAFSAIQQGGARRSANMAVLNVDHPDIVEFISCKAVEGNLSNFNISVGITDDFMKAVFADALWDLKFNGEVYETISANWLFDRIVEQAHSNGEPGLLFIDRANLDHPTPQLGKLKSTNPCGEQWMLGYENCCLGSINLSNHVKGDDIDWQKLEHTVNRAVRFLDNVIEVNKYVPAIPELAASAKLTRRIGLGIMGLADVFYKLRIRYGSPESLVLAAKIMEYIHYTALWYSSDLAKTRGTFLAFEGSIFDPENFRWKAPETSPDSHVNIDWEVLGQKLLRDGIRNAAVTTIAPTGTLATVAGVEGYGCEPTFALAYTRYVVNETDRTALRYVSPLFEKALQEALTEFESFGYETIMKKVELTGSCQACIDLPSKIKDVFVVSQDITPKDHVLMQATLQRYVSNAISKTCNFPATASTEDVRAAYLLAWELGCKGLTVYIEGSREVVVLETNEQQEKVSGYVWNSLFCPSCHEDSLQFLEGCVNCVCGYSACAV